MEEKDFKLMVLNILEELFSRMDSDKPVTVDDLLPEINKMQADVLYS